MTAIVSVLRRRVAVVSAVRASDGRGLSRFESNRADLVERRRPIAREHAHHDRRQSRRHALRQRVESSRRDLLEDGTEALRLRRTHAGETLVEDDA